MTLATNHSEALRPSDSPTLLLNRRGPLHPAWLPALRRRFAAGSVPVAQLNWTLSNVLSQGEVPRPRLSAPWGPNAHSAPLAVVAEGPLHPAWRPSFPGSRRFPQIDVKSSKTGLDMTGPPL